MNRTTHWRYEADINHLYEHFVASNLRLKEIAYKMDCRAEFDALLLYMAELVNQKNLFIQEWMKVKADERKKS